MVMISMAGQYKVVPQFVADKASAAVFDIAPAELAVTIESDTEIKAPFVLNGLSVKVARAALVSMIREA